MGFRHMRLKICFLKERLETHRCSTDENPFHHFHTLYLLNTLITSAAEQKFKIDRLRQLNSIRETQQLSILIKE